MEIVETVFFTMMGVFLGLCTLGLFIGMVMLLIAGFASLLDDIL